MGLLDFVLGKREETIIVFSDLEHHVIRKADFAQGKKEGERKANYGGILADEFFEYKRSLPDFKKGGKIRILNYKDLSEENQEKIRRLYGSGRGDILSMHKLELGAFKQRLQELFKKEGYEVVHS